MVRLDDANAHFAAAPAGLYTISWRFSSKCFLQLIYAPGPSVASPRGSSFSLWTPMLTVGRSLQPPACAAGPAKPGRSGKPSRKACRMRSQLLSASLFVALVSGLAPANRGVAQQSATRRFSPRGRGASTQARCMRPSRHPPPPIAPRRPFQETTPAHRGNASGRKPGGQGLWIGGYWAWDDDRNDFSGSAAAGGRRRRARNGSPATGARDGSSGSGCPASGLRRRATAPQGNHSSRTRA